MSEIERHPSDHGWNTEAGYICDGCNVRGVHEHRCHEDHAGPQCTCEMCHPSDADLAAFRAELGLA